MDVDTGTTHALHSSSEVTRFWELAHFGEPLQVRDEAVLASLGLVPKDGVDQERNDDNPFYYDDDW